MATADLRAEPDYLIIGTTKGGTTSLAQYLSDHPLVVPPAVKELHYFDRARHRDRSLRWYRSWFPMRATLATVAKRAGEAKAVTGEATPSYLALVSAARAVRAVSPRARLIALLREPGERAWSHYRMGRKEDASIDEFARSVEAEALDCIDGRFPPIVEHDADRHAFLRRGHYADMLAPWYEVFPAEQILLLRSEDLFAEPAKVFERVCEHVGIPSSDDIEFIAHNEGVGGSEVPEPLRSWLDEHYALPNERLSVLSSGAITWP
jgi:hypothetical protein